MSADRATSNITSALSSDREFDGIKVHLSLVPNPSHLEAADPVVLGKSRAVQTIKGDREGDTVLPILLHGDAAFAGQGVVWECFSFSGLPGYGTGGTIHFIINNQIGFTTSPQFGRSSPYPSDVAKGIQSPILHVNGDDPEAVTFCCKLAIEYRQEYNRDIVIDMWCYRRFGHNEGDEPSFTQPLMYAEIAKHAADQRDLWRAADRGGRGRPAVGRRARTSNSPTLLEGEFAAGANYLPNKADWFEGRWAGLGKPGEPVDARRNVNTAIDADLYARLPALTTTVPESLAIHKTLGRIIEARKKALDGGAGDRLGDRRKPRLRRPGRGRLSGSACRARIRAAAPFRQRHAAWVDQQIGEKYIPLRQINDGDVDTPRFEVRDSPLSEFGVLGFEYGYSIADPKTLVLWEAQFGDFANGAQTIIDQFIAAGEAKWLRASGLVLLLPHGFEGQGPEHSSARLERFLQLCAEDNIQVANCTTPANYFHILRRQMLRDFRKPLVIMTPKSLLRHKLAVSTRDDFTGEGHFKRILSDLNPPAPGDTRRLVLCSGKLAYELMEARDAAGDLGDRDPAHRAALSRSRRSRWKSASRRCPTSPNWCGRRKNRRIMARGASSRICSRKASPTPASAIFARIYAGRAASASPATGLAKRHVAEQAALIADALGERDAAPAAAEAAVETVQKAGKAGS